MSFMFFDILILFSCFNDGVLIHLWLFRIPFTILFLIGLLWHIYRVATIETAGCFSILTAGSQTVIFTFLAISFVERMTNKWDKISWSWYASYGWASLDFLIFAISQFAVLVKCLVVRWRDRRFDQAERTPLLPNAGDRV
jgi:hypothetical protein